MTSDPVASWVLAGFAPDGQTVVWDELDLEIAPGSAHLVIGPSGSGKSSLLRSANGLAPHHTGGRLWGEVMVGGRSIRTHRPRDLADVVGFVQQDPRTHFVVDHVEHDLAFALENLGYPPVEIRRRIDDVCARLGIDHLRDRAPTALSGGERQRVAVAGALVTAPELLVLDEPTAELDPGGSRSVFAALRDLHGEHGVTLLLAEHRLQLAGPMATGITELYATSSTAATSDDPRAALATYPGRPPVTLLGQRMGWEPLPLTVREAEDHLGRRALAPSIDDRGDGPAGPTLVSLDEVTVHRQGREALTDLTIRVTAGEVLVVVGENGSGKTTMLQAIAGLAAATTGDRSIRGDDVTVGFVPQDPDLLLTERSVGDELAATRSLRKLPADPEAVEQALTEFGLLGLRNRHPRTLSGGERQRLAVAAIVVADPDILVLDEPTRGIDEPTREQLAARCRRHAERGGAVVVATHDVELAAALARRVAVLDSGRLAALGRPSRVLPGTTFAPQIARLAPPSLQVADLVARLDSAADSGVPS